MKRLALLLLVMLLPSGLHAQTAVDTVDVHVVGLLAAVEIREIVMPVRVGRTIQFRATAYDTDGDTLSSVLFTWASSDPTIMSIDASTGLAQTHAKGNVRVSVMAEQVDSLAMGWFNPDTDPEGLTFRWARDAEPRVTEGKSDLLLCAYLFGHGNGAGAGQVIVQSSGVAWAPCPTLVEWPAELDRQAQAMWVRRQRVLPFADVAALTGNMRLDPGAGTGVTVEPRGPAS